MWYWLNSQKNSLTHSFCAENDQETTFDKKSSEKNLFVKGPFSCPEDGSSVEFQGDLNSKNLPNGSGRFHTLDRKNQPSSNLCFELPPNIDFIAGTFVKGLLHGKTKIKYSDDNSYMEATFFKGVIHGKIRHFDDKERLFFMLVCTKMANRMAHFGSIILILNSPNWTSLHLSSSTMVKL